MAARPDDRPVPATRRSVPSATIANGSVSSGPISSGLLINVIRTLTTSVNEDQRELEKKKLEKGYKESGDMIERLIKEHQGDIENCLSTFKDVSSRISVCRERVINVRNALGQCKQILENKRDDLKKLWVESSEQRHVVEIMNKLDDLRNIPIEVEILMDKGAFETAAETITRAKVEMREVECIEGLGGVRTRLEELRDDLTTRIMMRIVTAVVDEPFEKNMAEMLSGIPEERIASTTELSGLAARLKGRVSEDPLVIRINRDVGALEVLDKELRVLERLNHMSAASIEKMIRATISLVRVRNNTDETHPPDHKALAQMIKVIFRQLEASRDAHASLAERTRQQEVLKAFWRHAQTSVDSVVSEHTGLSSSGLKSTMDQASRLFRFEGTAYASFVSSSTNNRVICRPDVYNIVPLYPWLKHLISTIEESSGVKPCTLSSFVELVVMKNFITRLNDDFTHRLDTIVRGARSAEALFDGSQKAYEMCSEGSCSEVQHLLVSMEQYAPQLAALWLIVITQYTTHVRMIYERSTVHFLDVNGVTVQQKKISAAWAADEDISRLLMSLPNWQLAHASDAVVSPMTGVHSEKVIVSIETAELMTNMEDVRRLAIVHESLRWLAVKIRGLLESIPRQIKTTLQAVRHSYERSDGTREEGASLSLIDRHVAGVEANSATCLLMLHLELRVHCFYHLLPLARPRGGGGGGGGSGDDVDQEVHDLGRDMAAFYKLLAEILAQPKLNYIFDGLGHLCAAIFIHSSQHMPRLTDAGKKRVCRNIWGVQQRLSQLTGRREAQLERARGFYELLSSDVDRIIALVPETSKQYSNVELGHLVGLAVRSHPLLSTQPGALEAYLQQLRAAIKAAR
ncbi:sec-8 [Pristionchus pacificus]|uniref:Exocyst complex component Sec8 n=1 Tax=Pristionchus pacificus TaxID=54126 RepID=A0A2A6CF05_PRIPA|nr:sec-8 [Pristionchus pacificus]|eukprot:PDM76591.1 sec-8 [Pristionchus pacificus]